MHHLKCCNEWPLKETYPGNWHGYPTFFCVACKYGKQTKRPWHTKGPQKHLHTNTQPGQVVSVDQLESTTPGFVAQPKDY